MMRKRLIPVLGILMGVWTGPAVFAHGAAVNYRITSKNVEIEAAFDTGEPMVNAQIAVYAPDQLSQPWLTGKADREGRFTFTPPADQMGTWQVRVRQAGHGKILNIPVSSESNIAAKASSSKPANPALRVVLGAVVVGGFVLTAVMFSARKQ